MPSAVDQVTPPHRRRKRWPLAALLAVLSVSACSASWNRSGLFNNQKDERRAFREHDQAWQQRKRGQEFSRIDMLMMVRRFEGTCLTSEINWVTVNLDQRLDMDLRKRGMPIECRFKVRARWPAGMFMVYIWTIELMPVSEEHLEILKITRTRSM